MARRWFCMILVVGLSGFLGWLAADPPAEGATLDPVAAVQKAPENGKDTHAEKILEYLRLTNTGVMSREMLEAMFRPMRTAGLSDALWDELITELVNDTSLIDRMVPVYKKYFSEAEMDALLAFYETPVGKKFLAVQGPIQRELLPVSQAWGMEVTQRVQQKLQMYERMEQRLEQSPEASPNE